MGDVCDTCGNDKLPSATICKFCGARYEKEVISNPNTPSHRTVNIEYGRPVVVDAIRKLEREIEKAKSDGVNLLTVIHGYGSSGKGGVIRIECRKILEHLESRGKIITFIMGERFSKKDGRTKSLLRRFPWLNSSDNLNKGNRGVTLVVIK